MGSTTHFADRALAAVEVKRSHVVVGLDPDYAALPPELRAKHEALEYEDEQRQVVAACREFLFTLLAQLVEQAVAVKPQLAYFEAMGPRATSCTWT
ncbi:MAG: hypothetical protein M5U22_04345 [Thermoleophilia bacterium]|nr:hypothetical protein [Thermoleophilia bacterium]